MKEIKNEEFPSEQGSFLFRLQRHTLITSGRNGRGKVQISQDRKSTKEKRDEKEKQEGGGTMRKSIPAIHRPARSVKLRRKGCKNAQRGVFRAALVRHIGEERLNRTLSIIGI